MTRIIACGGRDYRNPGRLFAVLDAAVTRLNLTTLITGGAMGADFHAQQWAASRKVENIVFKAKWGKFGLGAGPIRNRQMLVEGEAEMVIAFPGNEGTINMIDQARKAGVEVKLIDWDGAPKAPQEGSLL